MTDANKKRNKRTRNLFNSYNIQDGLMKGDMCVCKKQFRMGMFQKPRIS